MKILGIRTSSTCVRYAILEITSDNINFVNRTTENKLKFPAEIQENIGGKLAWLYTEIEDILRQNKILKIIIKPNEYGQREKAPLREGTHFDSVVILLAAQKSIPCQIKLNKSIGINSKNVKSFAESSVEATPKYWDEQMATAVSAALSERKG